jgi:hypothetical protein
MVYLATLALLLFCAFAKAQNPPPSMSDTFEGMGEVEFHGAEATAFGKCEHFPVKFALFFFVQFQLKLHETR